ncbi:NAD(P)-binding protein [Aspergillus granulosus]|uniref:NAD(P)-binding protein n=1 Tax=Aspergillus granulosus TaxID=176169 RepID=A0ABR4HJS8_9EURO
MPTLDIRGKKALITGGGSGINLAFAKALYNAGCSILIADISLHSTAKEWLLSTETSQSSSRVYFHKTDVRYWTQLEETFNAFERQFNGDVPDIVVPGAGLYEPSTNTFWGDQDSINESRYNIFDVNIMHPIKMTRIAVRRMRLAEKKAGVILHLSSITAQKPSVTNPLYSVSKQAISQFVRCMAPLERLSGIRVVAVAPGVVDTPLFRDSASAREHIDLENDFILPPEEIVKAMMALVVESKYSSGTVLEVADIGGWREVKLLNDGGPQGRAASARAKAAEAIRIVEEALRQDSRGSRI